MFLNNIPRIQHTKSENFFLIAGPCIIEEEYIAFDIASKILKITNKLNIPFIFKASYQKANRSRLDSFRGIGNKKSLEIIKTDADNDLIYIKGSVPGSKNTVVYLKKSIKSINRKTTLLLEDEKKKMIKAIKEEKKSKPEKQTKKPAEKKPEPNKDKGKKWILKF